MSLHETTDVHIRGLSNMLRCVRAGRPTKCDEYGVPEMVQLMHYSFSAMAFVLLMFDDSVVCIRGEQVGIGLMQRVPNARQAAIAVRVAEDLWRREVQSNKAAAARASERLGQYMRGEIR